MMETQHLQLSFRPVMAEDKAAVMELSSHIWEGDDYVPEVFDDWLADDDGLFGLAETILPGGETRLVGFGKLTITNAPGDWWMEGLRIHPDFQGQGAARQLHEYLLRYWETQGGKTLRLLTSIKRYPVHHLCETTGFWRGDEYTNYGAAPLVEPTTAFRPLPPEDIERALAFIQASETFPLTDHMISLIWQWTPPNTRHVKEAIERGHAWWWREGEGLLLIGDDWEGPQWLASIEVAACRLEALPELLVDYRRLCHTLGSPQALWAPPMRPELLEALQSAGFERVWDSAVVLFERK